jgi:hypothetical protein
MQALRRFFLIVAAAGMPLLNNSAFAADPGVCQFYAKTAVGDFNYGTYGANQDRCTMLTISFTTSGALQPPTLLGIRNRARGRTF